MPGTQLPEGLGGAFVNVYISASTISQAIKEAESQLLSDCYKPVFTSAAYVLDLEASDSETDEDYPSNEVLDSLVEKGGYWYSPFYGFPPEGTEAQ